jgi:DNA replication protein DnaC
MGDNMRLIKDCISADWSNDIPHDEEKKICTWQSFCEEEAIPICFFNVMLSDLMKLNEIGKEAIKRWMKREINTLIFFGGAGSGKTHAALALLRHAYNDGKKWVRFLTAESLLHEGKEHGPDYLRRKYGECPYLVIDDLGVERPAEWETKYFFAICDERYSRKLSTIITTNLDQNALEIIYTKRAISRLQATSIKFNDLDWREML